MDSPDVPYHGVNLPPELWEESGSKHALWGRLPMGFKPSPYIACRNMTRALEFARGKPDEVGSPFAFGKVVLNLPGSPLFDPTQPWVQKLTEDDLPLGTLSRSWMTVARLGGTRRTLKNVFGKFVRACSSWVTRMPRGSNGVLDSDAGPGTGRSCTRIRDSFGGCSARSAGTSSRLPWLGCVRRWGPTPIERSS